MIVPTLREKLEEHPMIFVDGKIDGFRLRFSLCCHTVGQWFTLLGCEAFGEWGAFGDWGTF